MNLISLKIGRIIRLDTTLRELKPSIVKKARS